MVKLNLGSGNFEIPGYQSIDRKQGQEAFPLGPAEGSVDEIRASHILEHWSHRETHRVLRDWVRALRPGGVLKVAVPDFAKVIQYYQQGAVEHPVLAYICGGQVDEDDYHKAVFDAGSLKHHLEAVGLVDIQPWESEVTDNASWEVSLNLQGTKPEAKPLEIPDSSWPSCHAANIYSQFGEDGILKAVFDRIGTENKYCVDVGAADGILFSNVRQFLDMGWSGLLIEADEKRFEKLADTRTRLYPKTICYNYKVVPTGERSLDSLLAKAGVPEEFDLLSMDVDGQEYYLWNSLLKYRPRVVVVEYSPYVDEDYIPPLGATKEIEQAGLRSMLFVAAARGYVCVARTTTNLVCLRKDIFESLEGHSYPAGVNPLAAERDRQGPKCEAVISVPRLGFNANWHSTVSTMVALQMHAEMVEGAFWEQCLTRGIEKVLARGVDAVLTIDYDSIFGAEHIIKLLQLLYDYPEYDIIVPRQMKRETNHVLFQMNGDRDFSKPVTQISTGHFGLTVFDKNVFSKIAKPWFHGQPAPDGTWNDGRIDPDIWFWKQVEKAGLRVGLANEVSIGHLELQTAWPSEQFEKVFQSISDYRENGQPASCGGGLRVQL